MTLIRHSLLEYRRLLQSPAATSALVAFATVLALAGLAAAEDPSAFWLMQYATVIPLPLLAYLVARDGEAGAGRVLHTIGVRRVSAHLAYVFAALAVAIVAGFLSVVATALVMGDGILAAPAQARLQWSFLVSLISALTGVIVGYLCRKDAKAAIGWGMGIAGAWLLIVLASAQWMSLGKSSGAFILSLSPLSWAFAAAGGTGFPLVHRPPGLSPATAARVWLLMLLGLGFWLTRFVNMDGWTRMPRVLLALALLAIIGGMSGALAMASDWEEPRQEPTSIGGVEVAVSGPRSARSAFGEAVEGQEAILTVTVVGEPGSIVTVDLLRATSDQMRIRVLEPRSMRETLATDGPVSGRTNFRFQVFVEEVHALGAAASVRVELRVNDVPGVITGITFVQQEPPSIASVGLLFAIPFATVLANVIRRRRTS